MSIQDLRDRVLRYIKKHPRTYLDIAEYIWRISRDINHIAQGTEILKSLINEGLIKCEWKYVSHGWRMVFGRPECELVVKTRPVRIRPRRKPMGGPSKKDVMLSLVKEGITDAKSLAEKVGVPLNYAKTFLYRYKKGEFKVKPAEPKEEENVSS
jgi:hypothetical protein